MDTEMVAAAAVTAATIIEPENLSRMMVSFCLAVYCNRIPHELKTGRR
jgi:hypothetical protein